MSTQNFTNATIVWPVLLLWSVHGLMMMMMKLFCVNMCIILRPCVLWWWSFYYLSVSLHNTSRAVFTLQTHVKKLLLQLFHVLLEQQKHSFDITIFKELHFSLEDTVGTLITNLGLGNYHFYWSVFLFVFSVSIIYSSWQSFLLGLWRVIVKIHSP